MVILDGTLSSLETGSETNAGLIFKLLEDVPQSSVYYEEGLQWTSFRSGWGVMVGTGINRQIQRAYLWLAQRYRPGDKIILVGYSRGAYAVRSLAGAIDRVGLLRADHANEDLMAQVYGFYREAPDSAEAETFAQTYCHAETPIEAVAVFDTVKALGLMLPVFGKWSQRRHAFHNHTLGDSIQHGFHALALHETRRAYAPVLWKCPTTWNGRMEQVWFRGNHGTVGGHLKGFDAARPLSNIPLVWMLRHLAKCGLSLPADWQDRYPTDPLAPATGYLALWKVLFFAHRKRKVGQCRSESIHPTVGPTG
ncbi:DUF2235 domain-containing protein [Algirhabdus cladophorae]|uniref:DUF2235 domain-containing protein n=1 Tax=Algirhabdus cladophorae TaxID=3377108 RepID=UPI003B84AFCC